MYWGRLVKIDTALYLISTQRNLAVAPENISMPLNPVNYGSISRALKHDTSFSQEPASTWGATKRVVEILDAKYANADLPAIVRDNWKCHLNPSEQELLLLLLLKFEQLFDVMLGEWNLPPVSIQLKEGAKPFHGKTPYLKGPQGYRDEGDRPTGIDRSNEVATILTMGLTFIHNPKEGSDSAYYLRF